jgi:serine/threonine protein kinase
MVEPFVSNGSVLNIMKYKFQSGLREDILAVIMLETLKGLEYIHRQGMIHRDVKAGNILIDALGTLSSTVTCSHELCSKVVSSVVPLRCGMTFVAAC